LLQGGRLSTINLLHKKEAVVSAIKIHLSKSIVVNNNNYNKIKSIFCRIGVFIVYDVQGVAEINQFGKNL
jgi:predicted HAD superfamily phosphohydrolase YqeG